MSATESTALPPPYDPKAGGDPPPSYDEMIIEAYKDFTQKLKDNPEATMKALSEALKTNASSENFVKEMTNLRTTISTLNNLFSKVDTGLAKFDAEKWGTPKDDGSVEVTEWQPKWKPIRESYTTTLLKSHDIATRLAVRVETFFKIVLPKLKKGVLKDDQKLTMLDWYLAEKAGMTKEKEQLEKDEKEAGQMYLDFQNVQTEVQTFKAKFDVYFEKAEPQAVAQLRKKIQTLDKKLKSLRNEWRTYSATLTGVGAAVGIAGAVMVATGFLAPLGWGLAVLGAGATVVGGVATGVLTYHIQSDQAELDSAQKELSQKLAELPQKRATLKLLVESLDDDMDTISAKLGTMMGIWSFIKSSAQEAKLRLETAIGISSSNDMDFLKDDAIDLSIEAYKKLYTCVKMYGEGYDKAD